MKKLTNREVKALASKIQKDVLSVLKKRIEAKNNIKLKKFEKTRVYEAIQLVNKARKLTITSYVIEEMAGFERMPSSYNSKYSIDTISDLIYVSQIEIKNINELMNLVKNQIMHE
jgi:hypothetical protein